MCVTEALTSSIISHFFEIRRRYLNASLTLYLFWRVLLELYVGIIMRE